MNIRVRDKSILCFVYEGSISKALNDGVYNHSDCVIQIGSGMLDIKGKEIFEGDIIKRQGFRISNGLERKDGCRYKKVIWSKNKHHIGLNLGKNTELCEIIGNIFTS